MLDKHSIFHALYFGGIRPWEESKLPVSKEYQKLITTSSELQKQVNSLLGDEDKKLLDEFLLINAEICESFQQDKFKEGFVLGTKLMIETFNDIKFDEKGA